MSVLSVDDVSKRFQGLTALENVRIEMRADEVLGLVGPNGAGKTTLVNVITGHMPADTGEVRIGETPITGLSMARIARSGIARTYQHMRLLDGFSVLENVLMGRHQAFRGHPWQLWRVRRREERAQGAATRELLVRIGLSAYADSDAGALSYGLRRRVEIARAIASEPQVLLLDEPTAGMTNAEAHEIGELVRALSREGIAVLLIEHNVKLVTDVSDRIAVLDRGRLIKQGTPAEVWADRVVRDAYLGELL